MAAPTPLVPPVTKARRPSRSRLKFMGTRAATLSAPWRSSRGFPWRAAPAAEPLLRYRGRAVTRHDVDQIRELVAAHPEQSRRALSQTLCSAWGWRQANGALRAMVCRGLMLALWRAGHIDLPAVRRRP